MNTFTEFNLPKFRAGQVLRHTDLNELVNYLDNQDRLTRMLLIGIGIIEGLMPRVEVGGNGDRMLVAGSGIGISSDGYLIYLENELELVNFYASQITPQEVMGLPPDGSGSEPGPVYHLLRTGELPDPVIAETGAGSVTEAAGQDPNFSLAGAGVQAISELPVGNYVLVLYLKRNEEDSDRCFSEVEDKTATVRYELKPFLIRKEDYILCTDDGSQLSGGVETSSPTFEDFSQPYIRRFGYDLNNKKVDLLQIDAFKDFFENYAAICQAAFPVIETAYINAFETYREMLNQSLPNPFSGLAARLQVLLEKYQNAFAAGSDQPLGVQYLFDYLRDLIAAHNEFVDSAVDLRMGGQILPERTAHPRHVVLGTAGVTAAGLALNTNECRSPFLSSAFHEENTGKNRRAQFLLERMKELVKFETEATADSSASPTTAGAIRPVGSISNQAILLSAGSEGEDVYVDLPFPDGSEGIRITPSLAYTHPLSDRAVPYYYRPAIRDKWNFFLIETGRISSLLGYHYRTEEAPYDEPLHYDLGRYSFFRVEGHIGEDVVSAYNQLKKLRKELDLPFDIQFVKLSAQLNQHLEVQKLVAEDLEMIYSLTEEELKCEIEAVEGTSGAPDFTALKNTLKGDLLSFDYPAFTAAFQQLSSQPALDYPAIECKRIFLGKLSAEFGERREQFHLFSSFAEIHQGLEHSAGVPKGGTLVMAYAEFPAGEDVELRVVGDFSLDYNCCADRGGAVLPETFLAAVPAQYCSDDTSRYELVTYPLGGTLSWTIRVAGEVVTPDLTDPLITRDDSGKYYFHPSRLPATVYGTAGSVQIELAYEKFGHRSSAGLTVYRKPQLTFPDPVLADPVTRDGRPVRQPATFEIADLQPTGASLTWLVSGEPVPENNDQNILTYEFPYSEGLYYEVRIIAQNGICRTEVSGRFRMCEEDVALTLPANAAFEQGETTTLNFTAAPEGGVFKLIDPEGEYLRAAVSPVDGGDTNEYQLSSQNLLKIGTYELIYRLPHCLKEARAELTVSLPPVFLDKYRFCSDDNTEYPVTLAEGGRDFSSNAPGLITQNGQHFFNPARVGTKQFNQNGVAIIPLTYTTADDVVVTRDLTIFLVPEIEAFNRRPLYARGEVMDVDACILEGYRIDFRVKPDIWSRYDWELLESGERKSGLEVSYDFRFRDGFEYRVKVEASTDVPLNDGDCPPDKIEVVGFLCPEVSVDFDLADAARTGALILPPQDPDVPTFEIAGSPVRIRVQPLGGVFELYRVETDADGNEVISDAPAILGLAVQNAFPCEEEKMAYLLDVSNDQLEAGKYRLSYHLRDCVDANGDPLQADSADFFLGARPVLDDAGRQPTGGTPAVNPLPDILATRIMAHRQALEGLRSDANVPRSNAFRFADELINTGRDLAPLLEAFERAAPAAIEKFNDNSGQLKAKYRQLVDTIVLHFLDRLVAVNPIETPASGLEMLREVVGQLTEAGIEVSEIRQSWNGEVLRDQLGAEAVAQLDEALTNTP